MYDLASKVLIVDEVPEDNIARYEVSQYPVSLVFDPRDKEIYKESDGEEIFVPMTSDDVDWDSELIKMLVKSVEDAGPNRILSTKNLDDDDTWLAVLSYFDKLDLVCKQVVVHPSRAVDMDLIDVHQSELCPKDKAFFLPPFCFVGVLATREDRREFGMLLANTEVVVCVNFEE